MTWMAGVLRTREYARSPAATPRAVRRRPPPARRAGYRRGGTLRAMDPGTVAGVALEEVDPMHATTLLLADEGWHGGPWFLLIPLFWLLVLVVFFTVLRRTAWRRGWRPGCA